MSVDKLIDLADMLANDLLTFARDHDLNVHDLLMATALSERMVQMAVSPGNIQAVLHATQEAEATFVAVSTNLEAN